MFSSVCVWHRRCSRQANCYVDYVDLMKTPAPARTTDVVVLVVDDESEFAETCARLLRRRGYRVVTAGSCESGRAALLEASPALLVSDLRLGDGDGLALVRVASALKPPIPSIVISAYVSQKNRAAALAAGAAAFLGKPFTIDAFARTVEQALKRGGSAD
jgi:two-component system response regulator PilR (NtrC family)